MRYRLRTPLTLMTLGPPLIAWAWFYVQGPDEFVDWLTFVGILSIAYWSLGVHISGDYPNFLPPSDN
jgi:hypothetical protein